MGFSKVSLGPLKTCGWDDFSATLLTALTICQMRNLLSITTSPKGACASPNHVCRALNLLCRLSAGPSGKTGDEPTRVTSHIQRRGSGSAYLANVDKPYWPAQFCVAVAMAKPRRGKNQIVFVAVFGHGSVVRDRCLAAGSVNRQSPRTQ